jgi:hypothetical protein
MKIYSMDLPYACFAVITDLNDRVSSVAPIGKWMLGKHVSEIKTWCDKKRGKLIFIEEWSL